MAVIEEIDQRYFLMETNPKDVGYIKSDDIAKSCDVCGEGKSYGRKQRLHLYIKPTYDSPSIACFNCGYRANLYSYLRDYHPSIFNSYKKEKMGHSFKELRLSSKKKDEEFISENFILDDIIKDEPKIILQNIPEEFDDIKKYQEPMNYLRKRGLEPDKGWLFSPKDTDIFYNNAKVRLSEYIIIPFMKDNLMYGFQALAFKQKRFYVFLNKGNESWKVENWFQIDKNNKIYVFESIYDRLSSGISNSISQLGSSLSEDRLNELDKNKVVFCLDNQNTDETAKRESLRYAKEGYHIFIWPSKIPNKFKDTNDLLKAGVSKKKIKEIIENNTFSGMDAILRLKII